MRIVELALKVEYFDNGHHDQNVPLHNKGGVVEESYHVLKNYEFISYKYIGYT